MTNLISLQSGTELVGDYRIDRVLGAGGFGITYLADEIALDRRVTIKEYFPSDFAARSDGIDALPKSQDCSSDYKWGLDRFMEEAQTLARFDHPNIVRVYRYFLANNTGYMVLNFEEGQSLKSWLKGLKRAPRQQELDAILEDLLDALEVIHMSDFLHRDIAPDNIIIRRDGQPVLIDFGSARGEIAANSKTVSALVKPGYSPYEQYAETSRQQGPWTDIYALGATLYHAVTGKRPPDAPSRMVRDELRPAEEAAVGAYRKNFLKAIDAALALKIGKRPQSIASWRRQLFAPDPVKPGWRDKAKKDAGAAARPPVRVATEAGAGAKAPAPASTAVPPPPDAPGPHGGILDFLDGLKAKPKPAAGSGASEAAAATPAQNAKPKGTDRPLQLAQAKSSEPQSDKALAQGNAQRAGTGTVARLLAKLKTQRNPIQLKQAPKQPKIKAKPLPEPKPPRPRRVRPYKKTKLRPVLFKLFVGVSVASAAVAMQDRLPSLGNSSAALTTASLSDKTGKLETQTPATSDTAAVLPTHRLAGHSGGTNAIAFSGDRQHVVTAGADSTLKIWDFRTGALLKTLASLDGPATDIAIKNNRLLSGHRSGAAVMWSLPDGEKLKTFKRNDADIWSVAFAGTTELFAASSHDWTVTLWNTEAASEPVHVFEGHKNAAQAVAFASTRRGGVVASGSADKTIKFWDPKSLKLQRTYRGHRDFVSKVAFSPDGRYMASASIDGNVRVWSTTSRRLYRSYNAHRGAVHGLAFADDNRTLVSAGEDGRVKVFDVRRRRGERTFNTPFDKVAAFSLGDDGTTLAVGEPSGTVHVYSLQGPIYSAAK